MKIQASRSSHKDTQPALTQALSTLDFETCSMILAFADPDLDPHIIRATLHEKYPQSQIHLASSCRGTRTHLCDISDETTLSVMLFHDDNSTFCTIAQRKDLDHIESQLKELLQKAIEQSACFGEIPAGIILTGSPGGEERILETISEFFKVDKIPLIGGSCADNTLEALWWSANQEEVYQGEAITFTLIFSNNFEIFSQFSSGCHITAHKGIVTECDTRLIKTIDNEPAALVYNQWSNLAIDAQIKEALQTQTSQNILSKTALKPLGKLINMKKHSSYHLLVHPESTDGQHLTLFANVNVGDQIALMEGTEQNLIERPEEIFDSLITALPYKKENVVGCIIVFCAGSAMALGPRVPEAFETFKESLGDIPTITFFSYGEQSCVRNLGYVHGNLMISINLLLSSESH